MPRFIVVSRYVGLTARVSDDEPVFAAMVVDPQSLRIVYEAVSYTHLTCFIQSFSGSRNRSYAHDELGIKPLCSIKAYASAGVDPSIMGVGPVPASRKALDKAGLAIEDIDLVEANEAFAAQSLAVRKDLNLDPEKTNVNGGAIAIGHPIGASGCRILITLIYEMMKRDSKYGLATLCIGGGMGTALIVER